MRVRGQRLRARWSSLIRGNFEIIRKVHFVGAREKNTEEMKTLKKDRWFVWWSIKSIIIWLLISYIWRYIRSGCVRDSQTCDGRKKNAKMYNSTWPSPSNSVKVFFFLLSLISYELINLSRLRCSTHTHSCARYLRQVRGLQMRRRDMHEIAPAAQNIINFNLIIASLASSLSLCLVMECEKWRVSVEVGNWKFLNLFLWFY